MSEDTTIEPLTTEEIARVRKRVADTRGWIDDEGPDLRLGCYAIAGMVGDEERLLATIDARDKTIAERDAEIARLRERVVDAAKVMRETAARAAIANEDGNMVEFADTIRALPLPTP